MFFRDYRSSGSDESPVPNVGTLLCCEEEALARARENAPDRVIFEMGLVIAVPLALAVTVGLLLGLAGIPV